MDCNSIVITFTDKGNIEVDINEGEHIFVAPNDDVGILVDTADSSSFSVTPETISELVCLNV